MSNRLRRPLEVCHLLEATIGGTRRHLVNLMAGLDPLEFRQRAIVSLERDPGFSAVVDDWRRRGLEVAVIPMRRRPAPLADLWALVRIVRDLRRRPPSILHLHSAKAGFLGRLAGRLARVPVVLYSPHAFPFLSGRGLDRPFFWAERLLVPLADGLVAVSRSEAALARRLGLAPRRVAVAANGVNPALYPPLGPLPTGQSPLVGLIGRYCRQKGQDRLLAAAPAVLPANTRFRLIGEGPDETRLKRLAERSSLAGRVEFLPARPGAGAELYRGLDLLVVPSRWEGLPYALLEGMARGLPVVASDRPELREALGDQAGLLVAGDDPQALAAAISRVLGDEELARRLGAAGRGRVGERFRLDQHLAALGAIYRQVAAKPPLGGPLTKSQP